MRFLVIGTNFISDLFADAIARLRALGADVSIGAVLAYSRELTLGDVNARLGELLDDATTALSVILPKDGKE